MNWLDDDEQEPVELKINDDYANRYDSWRKSEELQKLKDKYGEDFDEDPSSTSDDEDEDAVELTEEVEANFFKTLACLKEKNPKIYDENVKFFKKREELPDESQPIRKNKPPSLSMAAYHRKVLLETNGIIEDDSQAPIEKDISTLPLVQQEKELKESFKAALADDSSEDEGEGMGSLLKAKVPSAKEKEKEEKDYRKWLAGQTEDAPEDASDLKGLRDYWSNPQLNEGEKFLRDYIVNHRYLEKNEQNEVENEISDSDEEAVKEQEAFESKFNFRFEEEDPDFIKRYPRTVEQSMRKKDDRRRQHRLDVKERKKQERAQKDEELKRLKALKRAEIMEKMKKLQEVTGNADMAFENTDIDGEFNPAEHDKRMSELFNEDYYGKNVDEEKPEFPDLDEELEIEKWEDWTGEPSSQNADDVTEPHCEDADFVMDCDYNPELATQRELQENTKRRKKRRQSKFAEALSLPKPSYDPTNSKFEQYLDEYYSLNYEDLIGNIPCRFKYRKTVPNDFGLTIEEILAAPDKELNNWASTKKIMRRRPEHVELYEVKAYQRKSRDFIKKKQMLPSLYASPEHEEDERDDQNPEKSRNASSSEAVKIVKRESLMPIKNKKLKRVICDPVSSTAEIVKRESSMPTKNKKPKKVICDPVLSTAETVNTNQEPSPKNDSSLKRKRNATATEEEKIPLAKKQKPSVDKKPAVNVEAGEKLHLSRRQKKNRKAKAGKINKNTARIGHNTDQATKHKKFKKSVNGPANVKSSAISVFHKNKPSNPNKKEQRTEYSSILEEPLAALTDSRLKSYGLNPKKFKNKLKYGPAK